MRVDDIEIEAEAFEIREAAFRKVDEIFAVGGKVLAPFQLGLCASIKASLAVATVPACGSQSK